MWGRNAREKVANGGHMCACCWNRQEMQNVGSGESFSSRMIIKRNTSCVIAAKGKLMHGLIRAFTVHENRSIVSSLLHISRENFSRDGALVTREFYLQSRRGYDHNCWQTPSLTRRCYILSRYTYNRYLENSLHNTSLEFQLVAYVHQASTLNSYIRCVYMLLIFL